MAIFETPEEEAIRKRAEGFQNNYEESIGEKVPEEPGILPDEITEGVVNAAAGGPAASMGRRLFATAAKSAGKSALSKLRDKGPPPASSPSIGGMGHSGPPPASGAGIGDSPYRKYQPMKETQATTGWESPRPWTPGSK